VFQSPYLRCPACQLIVADPELALLAVDAPAPCCGAHGEARTVWPGLQASKLLEVAQAQDRNQPDGHRIELLFFASALEVMLEDVLVEVLRQHTSSRELRDAVLDSYQGVERRRTLFGRLSGTTPGDLLRETWGQEFLRDWTTLASRRNKVAHGAYYYRGSEDLILIDRMRRTFLKAFVEMHNHVTRRKVAREAVEQGDEADEA
jgi:hypothetical protein